MYLLFVENCIFEKKGYLNLLRIVSESRCVSFLIAVTNHHELCGLNKFILSQLWIPEVQDQYYWANMEVLEGPHPLQILEGRICSSPLLVSLG